LSGNFEKEDAFLMEKSRWTVYRVVSVAVFAALVFVGSVIQVPIPAAFGMTRIHLGNIFCLLSGFILGPLGGGLAAGIGSGLYDIVIYGDFLSAPFTLVFKGLMAVICGLVAYAGKNRGENHKLNIAAGISGSVTYIILYLAKSFAEGLLIGSAMGTVLTALVTKLATSSVNAVIAVVVSVPLCAAVKAALKKSGLLEKL
jgi:uncharacterized membrane protein